MRISTITTNFLTFISFGLIKSNRISRTSTASISPRGGVDLIGDLADVDSNIWLELYSLNLVATLGGLDLSMDLGGIDLVVNLADLDGDAQFELGGL